jgi:alkylhydroperoxidase family enzyme
VRPDLAAAHARSLEHVRRRGATLTAARRVQIARCARAAYLDPEPSPPWVRPFGDAHLDVAHRVARHAGTVTEAWYREMLAEGMSELEWVEVVGVVCATVPPVAFARAIGAPLPEVDDALDGDAPTGHVAERLAAATLNWVPVAAPADIRASVVQALSALPDEFDNLWRLAAAQYMSDSDMADPAWSRGTLSRPQMELVAGRISRIRECFF